VLEGTLVGLETPPYNPTEVAMLKCQYDFYMVSLRRVRANSSSRLFRDKIDI
jgi:hypothetical protein